MNLKRKLLSVLNYIQNKNNDLEITKILEFCDFKNFEDIIPNKLEKILIVTPEMNAGMGGLTSVLRIANVLSKLDITIHFCSYESDDCKKQINNAKKNLSEYDCKYISTDIALKNQYDFIIATNWISLYYSKKFSGFHVYFIQDYEPLFYPYGDRYFLAKKSLFFGEKIISLGKWNLEEIKRNSLNLNINCETIDFPFEKHEYPFIKRDFNTIKSSRRIRLAVYIKREQKRMPSLIMAILNVVYENLLKHNIVLEINYFGLNYRENVKYGKNRGRLTKQEIKKLYYQCDLGMVASMTNISLVPYEMISSGLPIIEFNEGSFKSFLGEESAILVDFNPYQIADILVKIVDNPNNLTHLVNIAYSKIENLSWNKTAIQFYHILKKIVQEP